MLSDAKKQVLERRLRGAGVLATAGAAPIERSDAIPLSFAQQRLWFVDQLEPNSAEYNITLALPLAGPLDIAALRLALERIVERHEVLRTRLVAVDGVAQQIVDPPSGFELDVTDLSLEPWDLAQAQALVADDAARAFDLASGPLIRGRLLVLAAGDHVLSLVLHHVVADEWSLDLLRRELSLLYDSFCRGEPDPLAPLPLQYADFAIWQRRHLQGEVLERQLIYWQERLTGAQRLALPTDRPQPPVRSSAGGAVAFDVPEAVVARLRAVSRQGGVTMFMTLLAAFDVLLGRYCGQDDIVVGTPIANRNRADTEQLIGFFVNNLVMRTDLSGDPSFAELVGRVRRIALDAYANQDLPFEQLVDALEPVRDRSRTPLFEVLFNYSQGEGDVDGEGDPSGDGVSVDMAAPTVARYTLRLFLVEKAKGLAGVFEYSSELFDAATVRRMVGHLLGLLEEVSAHPTRHLSELSGSLEASERHSLLVDWNDTAAPLPLPAGGVHDLVAARAAQHPDATALMYAGRSLSYRELDERANRLAHYLRAQGVEAGREIVVGLCVERGLDTVVGLLGVLKAGGAYLPLDPEYPAARLGFMLADSRVSILVGHSEPLDGLPLPQGARLVLLDDPATAAMIARQPYTPVDGGLVNPDQLAYVIYTSGSTGRPKAVMVPHRGVVNLATGLHATYGLGPGDVALQFAPFSFDTAVWDVFMALGSGAALCIATPEARAEPSALAGLVRDTGVSLATFPPSLLAVLDPDEVPGLAQVVSAGERLEPDLARRWGEATRLYNSYGPTETSVAAAGCELTKELLAVSLTPPVGRPNQNAHTYVLDRNMAPVPVGVLGELYIGGFGVARGYGQQPALSAERFVADPFGAAGTRLYRSGDRVRWRPDGQLEFLGRVDEQVKVRGHRIEPAEIEAVLLAHPRIAQTAVVAQGEGEQRRLVAYAVAPEANGGIPSTDELRAWVGSQLPPQLVPGVFVALDALPLNPNGKLDRNQLPRPEGTRPRLGSDFAAPRTPTEEVLAKLWAEILGVDRPGVHDSFFDLGGHSLLATQVVSRLRVSFGVELALVELFDQPTVSGLARVIDGLVTTAALPIVAAERQGPVPLSFAQQRLWFLDQLEPGSADYSVPAGLRLLGSVNVDALAAAVGALVERHEILRTRLLAIDGVAQQVIDPPGPFDLEVVDLSSGPGDPETQVQMLAADDAAVPFDLAAGPLFRARLLRLGPDEHVLSLVMHHAVTDEWSTGVLHRELSELYDAFRHGEPSPLERLPIQYADFAIWQRHWLQGEELDRQLGYWKEHLARGPPLELPTDRPRPPVRSSAGAAVEFTVPPETVADLRELSAVAGATMFMTLLAAFKVVLGRNAAQDDVVVGTTIANRNRTEIEGLIGFFVNTLVLRTDLSGDPTFSEVLARVRSTALGAYAHQDLPFEHLVEALQPERDRSRTPLFQVLFDYTTATEAETGEPDPETQGSRRIAPPGPALFDLTLVLASDTSGALGGLIQYSTELFDRGTVERLASQLVELLVTVAPAPSRRLSELPLPDCERRQVLHDWTGTAVALDATGGVHGRVASQAALHPEAAGVVCGERSSSYAALDIQANRLAHHLGGLGVGPETVVGLCFERAAAPDMVVALLAVLKAGGAYLPLDADYPAERLAFMLTDSHASVLIGSGPHMPRRHRPGRRAAAYEVHNEVQNGVRQVVWLDDPDTAAVIASQPAGVPDVPVEADGAACVIYTSGSTGRPKGVLVTHRGLLNVLAGWTGAGFESGQRWLSLASFGFDVFTGDFVRALCTGGTLVVAATGLLLSVEELTEVLSAERINAFECAPRFVDGLVAHLAHRGVGLDDLRLLVVTTDTWRPTGAARARQVLGPNVRLLTAFGLTETTIDSTCCDLAALDGDLQTTPIGSPLANTLVYVLERSPGPAPVGAPGELYIGGAGVARGYGRRPALTAERFVADPFATDGSRLYRTGDRGRWRADGQLEFRGRLDQQLNVRGYRVEPGEIETALVTHPAVGSAVVIARDDGLVGYLVATDATVGAPSTDELRAFLAPTLPGHMVPGVFVELDQVPETPNGKVDRAALPAPPSARPGLASGWVAPRTPTEQVLAGLWAEVLDLQQVGVHDNFFDLGGHSLLATQVVSRVRGVFGVELGVAELFDHPTLADLAEVVDGGTAGDSAPAITAIERDGPLPLSFAQQRLWFLDQLEPGGLEYVVPLSLQLDGRVDVGALTAALEAVVERHEVLRTRLVGIDGVPWQVIDPPGAFDLPVVDLSNEPDRWLRAEELVAEDLAIPFDLATGPLFRGRLIRISAEDHLLSLAMHHVVSDEWSARLLRQELLLLYNAFMKGDRAPLLPLHVQYADFAVWQRDWLQSETLERQLGYWRDKLTGAPTLELPTDRPRPHVRSGAGGLVDFDVPESIAAQLGVLSRELGATLFMTLLAAFKVLLSRYCGQDDVVVGTPVANRNRVEIEPLIGCFLNTLVLRTDLSGDPSFAELVARVRHEALGAYAHQDLPFEQLVDELQPERDRSRSALFQVMFNYEQDDDDGDSSEIAPKTDPVANSSEQFRKGTSKFDLTLSLVAGAGAGLQGSVEYSTELFDRATIQALVEALVGVLGQVGEDSGLRLSELGVLGDRDWDRLVRWNDTEMAYPALGGIHELVTARSQRQPETAALVCGSDAVTYADLEARSNQMAQYLCCLGVGPEDVVGLCLERSIDMVVAILAVWKVGGAYLALDPEFPPERLRFMAADAGMSVVLAHRAAPAAGVVDDKARSVWLDDESTRAGIGACSPEPVSRPVVPDQLAYVMYTSGSTGRPKAVLVSHRSLVSFLTSMAERPGLGADDVVLAVTTLGFDIANLELLLALVVGARVVVATRSDVHQPARLVELIRTHGVSVMQATPVTWAELLDAGELNEPSLRVLCGGEALSAGLATGLAERAAEVWNMYGPTETTVWSACGPVPGDGGVPSLGSPVGNTTLWIMDGHMGPASPGVSGELYIGGTGVTRGYGGQAALTAARFVADPLTADGSRLYRTGDRARWRREPGDLEFLGRLDDQLKVRGFRVEPAEIEAALTAQPGINTAVVVALGDGLVAYVTPADGADSVPSTTQLRQRLADLLPSYMIPGRFVELAILPLTPNGKVDRNGLPEPEGRSGLAGEPVAPRTPTETVLASIWADVLDVDQVGVEDSFFDLGGHSLLATRMVSQLQEVFGIDLALAELFDHPTVARLSQIVDSTSRGRAGTPITPVERSEALELPLSFAQQRLWFYEQLEPGTADYNIEAGLRLQGPLDALALSRALASVVERHEVLRTRLVSSDGVAHQVIDPPATGSELEVVDVSTAADASRRAAALVAEDASQPFDLAAGPLWRGRLIRIDAEDHVMSLVLHHVICDEWSTGVLHRELAAFYEAFRNGEATPLAPLAIQYADFAVWQRGWLQGEILDAQLAYWRDQLAGAPALNLPTDRARPAVRTSAGKLANFAVPHETVAGLRRLSQQSGSTMFMTLLAAFGVLMGQCSGQDDIVVGSPIANRNRAETEDLVGFFVNTLVLRLDLSGDPTFSEILARVRRMALGAYAHQDLPFEQLVEELQPDWDRSRTPLAQVLFNYDPQPHREKNATPTEPRTVGQLVASPFAAVEAPALTDLRLILADDDGGGLAGTFEYSTELFDPATIAALARRLVALLKAVVQ